MERFIGQLAVKVKQVKVDAIDRKILYLLSLNARLSNTAIAKHLKLSREIVAYRIKRMQELDILHGFLTLINLQNAGMHCTSIGIKLHNTVRTEDVIKDLRKIPSVGKISHYGGLFDLRLTLMENNPQTSYGTIQQILAIHGQKIRTYQIFTELEQDFLGLKMLIPNKEDEEYLNKVREKKGTSFQEDFRKRKKSMKEIEIDETDRKILQEIKLDARVPLTELEERTGVSIFQLKKRISRLIQQNVIGSFIPYISLAHLNLQFHIVLLNVHKNLELKFRAWIKNHPYIAWRTKNIGPFNYRISVFAKNNAHLSSILNELCTEFEEGVSHIEILPVFDSVQNLSFPS